MKSPVNTVPPSESELAILDRITKHPNAGRFLPIPIETHRYYLASSPKGAVVLRLKDNEGLNEWKTRRWIPGHLFPDPPPTITDVTLKILELVESSLSMSMDAFLKARTWVVVEDGYRFVISGSELPPSSAIHRRLWASGGVAPWPPSSAHTFQHRPGIPFVNQAGSLSGAAIGVAQTVVPGSGILFANNYGAVYFTPNRAFVWRGAPPMPYVPIAGAAIDGVSTLEPQRGNYASRGKAVMIEAGGSFDEETILECDAEGRAIARGSGVGVLRSLESGEPGKIVWAVFV